MEFETFMYKFNKHRNKLTFFKGDKYGRIKSSGNIKLDNFKGLTKLERMTELKEMIKEQLKISILLPGEEPIEESLEEIIESDKKEPIVVSVNSLD